MTEFSSARARLIAQDGIIAEHPDHDRTFWQRLYLVRSNVLIGGAVIDHRRAGCLNVRTDRRAA